MRKTLQSQLKWRKNYHTQKRRLFRKQFTLNGSQSKGPQSGTNPLHGPPQKTVALKNLMFTPKSKMDRSPTAIPQTNVQYCVRAYAKTVRWTCT